MPSIDRSPYFSIQSKSVTIYRLDFLHTRAIVVNNSDFSLIILHPESKIAFAILEEGIGTFDELQNSLDNFPVEFQDSASLTLPDKGNTLNFPDFLSDRYVLF